MSRALPVFGMAAGLLATVCLTLLVFGLPLGESLANIWDGAAGDRFGIARSLVRATPLILCGLGITLAWRAKMYNIGGEGQYVLGGIAGAWMAKLVVPFAPNFLGSVAILIGAALGGAALAALAGWLYVRRGVQVVISTILLNFVALQILEFVVGGPLQESAKRLPQTERLPQGAMLARFDPQTDLHAGLFVALVAAVLLALFLFRTMAGFRLRLVGANARAAHVSGVDVPRLQFWTLVASGGLCGLAGGVDYAGLIGQVGPGFAQDWGFLSIPVALLGGLHPLGVLASGVFFGGLFAGSENLARFNTLGGTVVVIVQAVAVFAYIGLAAVRGLKPADLKRAKARAPDAG